LCVERVAKLGREDVKGKREKERERETIDKCKDLERFEAGIDPDHIADVFAWRWGDRRKQSSMKLMGGLKML
jgi:hypothetical protein